MCLEYLNLDVEEVSIHVAFVSVLSLLQKMAFLQDLLITGNEQEVLEKVIHWVFLSHYTLV